jgi:hypothetical protein
LASLLQKQQRHAPHLFPHQLWIRSAAVICVCKSKSTQQIFKFSVNKSVLSGQGACPQDTFYSSFFPSFNCILSVPSLMFPPCSWQPPLGRQLIFLLMIYILYPASDRYWRSYLQSVPILLRRDALSLIKLSSSMIPFALFVDFRY